MSRQMERTLWPTVYDQFLDEMEAAPDDFTIRSIFADWCEDNGKEELAECLRWMVENGKRPRIMTRPIVEWVWYDEESYVDIDVESDLPSNIFKRLGGFLGNEDSRTGVSGDPFGSKRYKTFRAAEEAFYKAWHAESTLTAKSKGEI